MQAGAAPGPLHVLPWCISPHRSVHLAPSLTSSGPSQKPPPPPHLGAPPGAPTAQTAACPRQAAWHVVGDQDFIHSFIHSFRKH